MEYNRRESVRASLVRVLFRWRRKILEMKKKKYHIDTFNLIFKLLKLLREYFPDSNSCIRCLFKITRRVCFYVL